MTKTIEFPKELIVEPVSNDERQDFLFNYFKDINTALFFENIVYDVSCKTSEKYKSGYWDFYRLNNGGILMCPDVNEKFTVKGYYGNHELCGFGFGAFVNLIASSVACTHFFEKGDTNRNEKFHDLYHQIRNFVFEKSDDKKYSEFYSLWYELTD